jgi:hypothetical protein
MVKNKLPNHRRKTFKVFIRQQKQNSLRNYNRSNLEGFHGGNNFSINLSLLRSDDKFRFYILLLINIYVFCLHSARSETFIAATTKSISAPCMGATLFGLFIIK